MPIKSFCFPPKELVASYSSQAETATATAVGTVSATLVVGARPCELRALQYLDRVFGNPPTEDPFYHEHRAAQVVVSVDCVEPHDTCFCNLVDGMPYASSGFDVNLTPINGGYVVEAGSEAGHALVTEAQDALSPASEAQLGERDRVRAGAVKRLNTNNAGLRPAHRPSEALGAAEDGDVWDRVGRGCVECGACTQICPTCHCFFLIDRGAAPGVLERLRAWDSCMWSGYSRMAGAPGMKPNPRSRFRTRFANRYLHKYVWSPQQWELLGCVGCGRCTEACPGQIDIRRVVREVSA
ncbi:MAG: 4Fe-4S dicluster domain-containing protein [Phycisphaerae bacterium]|nr:4Fe-4S dicluster domain-containing protein [Phycisphaerae bacterium]